MNCKEIFTKSVSDRLEDKAVIGVITVKAINLESLDLKMRSNGTNCTELTLDDGRWVFNRSRSGEIIVGVEKDEDSKNGIRRMPCSYNKEITLTIVMDDFSVEIFEDGRSMSSAIYPPEGADGIELIVKADACEYTRAEIVKTV